MLIFVFIPPHYHSLIASILFTAFCWCSKVSSAPLTTSEVVLFSLSFSKHGPVFCNLAPDLFRVQEMSSYPLTKTYQYYKRANPLKPELNPICYLLALLGAHHFLHVSRIGVKLLTLRRLMLYIYIWSTHS